MKAFFKYAIVLLLGFAVGFVVNRPLSVEDGVDEITVILNKAFIPAKPKADSAPIDLAAVASVDEDLDYRIAQRIGSLEGWRSFLAAHGSGAHAQSARAEAQVLAGKAPAQAAAELPNSAPTDAKAENEVATSAPPSSGTEVAALAAPVAQAAAELPNSAPTDAKAENEVAPSAPPSSGTEVAALAAQAAAPPIPPVMDGSALDPKWRATGPPSRTHWTESSRSLQSTGPPSRTHWTESSRSLQPRRHANGCAFKSVCFRRAATLPPILLALIGARPKNSSAFGHTLAYARPNDLRGR